MREHVRFLSAALLVGAMVIMPMVAQAGLIGDTVTATLQDTDAPATIFSGSAVVTDPGPPEFSGIFDSISWTLDILNNSFVLQAICLNSDNFGCPSGAIKLTLSGLDFTPPANLVALSNINVTEPLLTAADPPVVAPSSVIVNFQAFTLGTGNPSTSSYSADFKTESKVVATPFPATLLLLMVGLPAVGILAVRRRLS